MNSNIDTLKEEVAQLSRELKQRNFELSILYDISNGISYTLSYDDVLQLIMASLNKIIDYDICVSLIILELEEEKKARMVIHIPHALSRKIVEEVKARVIRALNGLSGEQISEEDVAIDLKGKISDDDFLSDNSIKSSFDVPVFVRDKAVGILNVSTLKNISYSEDEIKLFYTLSSQASATVERLQAVLNAERNKMKVMVEGMSEGVIMFDENDRLIIFNSAARSMLGYLTGELNTNSLLNFFSELGLINSLEDIKKDKKSFSKEINLDKPYARIVRIEGGCFLNDEGKDLGIALVLRDVTREREIDRMKDDFISLVSHELRTPLAAIKGATDNLLDGIAGRLNTTQNECLMITQRNIDRLGRLISDLLDVSRIEAGKIQLNKEKTNMNNLINDTLKLFQQPAKDKNIKLEVSLPPEPPQLNVDPDKITQVITNLIGNAMKFTPSGGSITLAAYIFESSLQVDVVDTGIGIPQKDLDRVFDKFYQVSGLDNKMKAKGTGLGLPICKGIVEKHGGKIWAESEPGQGSKFSFVLPLNQKEA